jgi:3-phosphoshikimate 1-carboxyvinyltransferase
VPGDISSAAFFLAAAALSGEPLTISDVGVNETRTGFLETLRSMGATVEVRDGREELGEPMGTVTVSGRISRPVRIGAEQVPGLIDELPLVALLATQVEGRSEIRGAAELRVKESDRIAATGHVLNALGAEVEELADGFSVRGPTRLTGTTVPSHGDHRLAMMLAVAGLIASGETVVEGAEVADISFPGFAGTLMAAGGRIDAG